MLTIKHLPARYGGGFTAVLLATVVIAVSGKDHPLEALPEGTVWVVNRDLGELTVFDAGTGDVLTNPPLPVGAGAHDVCVSERSGKAYVTAEGIDKVTTVDLRTFETESITVAPLPHHCEVSHDGETVYISLASHSPGVGTPRVAVIDTTDNSVSYLATNSNPGARSHGLFPSREGDRLFVAHDMGNALSVVNLQTGLVDFTVPGILRAEEPIATRSGNSVWVSARGENAVKLIDLDTHTIATTIAIDGMQPESVMLTPSERTLAISLRGSPAALAFVDTEDRQPLESVVFPVDGVTFGDLAVMTQDGRYVYATYDRGQFGVGGVAIVDVRERRFVDSWEYPTVGRPHGVAFTKRRPHK